MSESDIIDYKFLLTRCMQRWFESEGVCWDGSTDGMLTDIEKEAVSDIYEEILMEYDNREERRLNNLFKITP